MYKKEKNITISRNFTRGSDKRQKKDIKRRSQQLQLTTVVLSKKKPETNYPPPHVGVTDLYDWATPEAAGGQHQHE